MKPVDRLKSLLDILCEFTTTNPTQALAFALTIGGIIEAVNQLTIEEAEELKEYYEL